MPESLPILPPRRGARRRDRRGRGLRGPVLPPVLPAWRTRAERFDEVVVRAAQRLQRRLPSQLGSVEFAVEEVPPSDPAPWERHAAVLARYFAADPAAGLRSRIVVYRRPVETRSVDETDQAELVRLVLVEQVSSMLTIPPEDVDPEYPA